MSNNVVGILFYQMFYRLLKASTGNKSEMNNDEEGSR